MRKLFDRKTGALIKKAAASLFAFFFAAVFCLAYTDGVTVKADSEVTISAVTKRTDVGPGDIIIVDVVANSFPDISEFGPIEFNFDADKAEYVSFEQGKDLSNYVFTETQTVGTLSVSGMDQLMSVTTDDNGDEIVSTSFSSDSQVTLFSIVLRLYPESNGEVNCWIGNTGTFTSVKDTVTAKVGTGVTLPIIRTGLSSDATLASLKIRGTTITPEFNPNITEYSCSVERSVTEVQVSVLANNLWAAVIIDGNQYLNMGDNIVNVNVTAQDGISHMHYTIHVLRKESNVPEDASLVDFEGNTYTFLDAPDDSSIPEGFTQTTRYINGYSVPAYVRDGVTSVLLYLFDGTQQPGFYFYNSTEKTVLRYDPENTLIESSAILKVVEVPSNSMLPDEFKPVDLDMGTIILHGYQNADGDFICYMADEGGNADFYYIDKTTGSISLYRFADKRAELLYSYLFDVFLVIAIIEAVIITITVYIVRKMVSERTNPRPKRV